LCPDIEIKRSGEMGPGASVTSPAQEAVAPLKMPEKKAVIEEKLGLEKGMTMKDVMIEAKKILGITPSGNFCAQADELVEAATAWATEKESSLAPEPFSKRQKVMMAGQPVKDRNLYRQLLLIKSQLAQDEDVADELVNVGIYTPAIKVIRAANVKFRLDCETTGSSEEKVVYQSFDRILLHIAQMKMPKTAALKIENEELTAHLMLAHEIEKEQQRALKPQQKKQSTTSDLEGATLAFEQKSADELDHPSLKRIIEEAEISAHGTDGLDRKTALKHVLNDMAQTAMGTDAADEYEDADLEGELDSDDDEDFEYSDDEVEDDDLEDEPLLDDEEDSFDREVYRN